MQFSLLFASTLVITGRAFYGEPQDLSTGNAVVSPTSSSDNLERGFKSVMGELNAMHGFMVSSEQSQLRQAQETKALQAQNAKYQSQSQQLQQQLQRLQQELQQARQTNANMQAKDAQLTSNYQKLSTASKKLAQQYKSLDTQNAQLRAKDQQEASQINSLNKEKSGLLGALRKFKGIIAAQSQQLDSAISGADTVNNIVSQTAPTEVVPEPSEPAMPAMPVLPEPAPLPASQPQVAPTPQAASLSVAPVEPLPSLPEAPPADPGSMLSPGPEAASSAVDVPDMGPLELGPPAAASAPSKDSKASKQKGKKSTAQQSSLEKDLNSLSDVRQADAVPLPGSDPDVSKIAQADDQVLQMARDAGFLPSV